MFGIGMPELLMILLVALLVVGPKKLPDLAKSLGKGISQFRKATEEIKESLAEHEAYQDLQDMKRNFEEAKDAIKPSALLDIDVTPSEKTSSGDDQAEDEPKRYVTASEALQEDEAAEAESAESKDSEHASQPESGQPADTAQDDSPHQPVKTDA